jgi:hypothetical protein
MDCHRRHRPTLSRDLQRLPTSASLMPTYPRRMTSPAAPRADLGWHSL